MARRRGRDPVAGRRSSIGSQREWVGGKRLAPMYVTEGEPYRPEIFLWLEMPDGLIIGSTLTHPNEPETSFTDSLHAAMRNPMVGRPRRPQRVRVADASLAAEVHAALGDAVPVTIAPTPELDAIVRELGQGLRGSEEAESYFAGGRVSPEAVGNLFRAAEILFRTAPWTIASNGQILRLDIPQLEVEGACVSIIGGLGECLGLLIFPSLIGYEAYLENAEFAAEEELIDMGTTVLALTFERGAEVPASMRREIAEHGWPVAAPNAYPRVVLRDRDGMSRPLSERDVRIVSCCAASFTPFFARHREVFEEEFPDPVCESYTNEDDVCVRFTVACDASSLFEINEPEPSRIAAVPRVGRNDPCPCGSGKKYKKCHLGAGQQAPIQEEPDESVHEADGRLVLEMLGWARERFGADWVRVAKPFSNHEAGPELLAPWLAYHCSVRGRLLVEWFLQEHGRHLPGNDRAWLASQRKSWLTVWEVLDVKPGIGLTVRDLLADEVRSVREILLSKTLVKRDAVLGRVVDHRGISVFCGVYPCALPPPEAAEVVRRVRSRLRRRRAVPVERLRDDVLGRYMIQLWDEGVAALARYRSEPPQLCNTDGDAVVVTVDHFDCDPEAREAIEARLAAVQGVEVSREGADASRYVFLRPGNAMHSDWETTVLGTAQLKGGKLRLETNSVKRADDLRRCVEKECGGLLRYRVREHCDPLSAAARSGNRADLPASPPPAEAQRLLREFKKRHYASWPDRPLPALGGETPRRAVRKAATRLHVDVLLKDIENHESRLPAGERFDFTPLRHELGLE